ncbi:hypothetical protein G6F42_015207 [Rhizopus arrhizus]|nr:hypothetical protein G6F42_015207 [Rhizopus arrhizus]
MSIFGKADTWRGSFSVIKWQDGARNVNVMLAVQNKDGTLSPVGQTTFNVAPYGTTIIDINRDTPVGRNYFFIAEDMIDPSNYTSVGPFAIYEANGDTHPTNSVAVTATERFLTDVRPTATSQSSTATGSIRSQSTYTPTGGSSKSGNNSEYGSPTHIILGVVQIVGIVIGCVGAVIVATLIYVCCCRKRTKGSLSASGPHYPPVSAGMGPNQIPGVPAPKITPTVKKQSIKKPVVGKLDSDTTVAGSIASPKLQENTTINMNSDFSYAHEMANQPPPAPVMPPQQAYHYYNNEMYYGSQMQYPSQDTMPVPTYFSNPTSPTSPSFSYMQQQQMYPPQMQAANYWNYAALPPSPYDYTPKPDTNEAENKTQQVPMTTDAATKTELAAASKTEQAESTLSQKFEMPVGQTDLQSVVHDTTSLLKKPNDKTAPLVQKPNTHSSSS